MFKRRSDNPDEVRALRAEVAAMSKLLAENDAWAKQARKQAEQQAEQQAESLTAAPTPGNDVDSLVGRIDALAARIDEVDARMAAVANELAAQIDEVGRDGAPTEELREAQVRLANEQARYQIQFNQHLAELAERVRNQGDNSV